MRALITGGGGQLASDLQTLLGDQATALTRAELDISDSGAVDRVFEEVKPDVVFNCAAFHNVDLCETNGETAWKVNVAAVRELARHKAKLVHISTNYVFDGRQADPYAETDAPNPSSMYAITKLAGEYAARAYGRDALVVRTSGLFGLHGSASKGGNFVQRMIKRAREQGSLRMVADQLLQPTYTADLGAALVRAVELGASGLAHVTAEDGCSWHEFTVAIMALAGIDVAVEPVSTTLAPGQPDRPLNGVLARPGADALGIPRLRPWRDALADYMSAAGLAA